MIKQLTDELFTIIYNLFGTIYRLQKDNANLLNELSLTNQGIITLMEELSPQDGCSDNKSLSKTLEDRLQYNRELINRLKQKEEELKHADRLATIGRMIAGIAHEINNPLTFIKINAEILSRHLQTQEETIQRPLNAIHQGVDRITNIVSNLKRFSRQEQKEKTSFNLSQCIDTAWALIASDQHFVKNITLIRDIAPNISLYGNKQQIEQVFINLLQNGINAIHKSGKKLGLIKITANQPESRNWVSITITDNGCGISPADMPLIFEPFFSKTAGGTGLGLSVVHGIITEHNGKISASSVIDQGSTFEISLPSQQKQEGDPS